MHRLLVALVLLYCAMPHAAEQTAPGLLIDVGGYRLHIACEGYGTPTVVFDAGLGGHSFEWQAVVERAREFTRVCTYDRAGYGWSDNGPLPRTSSVIANELYLLLTALDFDAPFVLAGHSYGGYNMQLFARRYPYLVAGLVLVDSSHPTQVERFRAPPFNLNTAPTTRWGMVKFGRAPQPHPSLPAAVNKLVREQMSRWRTRRTLAHEFLGFRDSARELRDAQRLAQIPVIVLSRGKRVWPADARGDQLEHLWMEMQTELAGESPYSAHIVAINSGHQVHLDQPDLVAYALAVLTDIHRLGHGGDPGSERQVLGVRGGVDFQAGVWLRDTLVAAPDEHLPVTATSADTHSSQAVH
ncbi:MAG: alpha/beta hydrolase [Gammaproteobacteria bacterium]